MMVSLPDRLSVSAWRDETSALLKPVSDAATLEAELLLEHVTGISRTRQRIDVDAKLTDPQLMQLNSLRQRRQQGEPLAYVLEEAHFWTLKLKVTSDVLIPRPETELIVERCLHHLHHRTKQHDVRATVLDLGTGSGAIALAIAKECTDVSVIACDISTTALHVARQNMLNLQLPNVTLVNSDWFKDLPAQRFDIIVSNPPYIAVEDPDVQGDVRAHEPHLALFSNYNGLQALQTIVQQAPHHLRSGGWLILEHGWQQAERVQELLESQGMRSVASHSDLAGHLRVTEAQLPVI